MTLEELNSLATTSPVLVHQVDADGRIQSLAARVAGEYPSRRLRALYEMSLPLEGAVLWHPRYCACDTGEAIWLLTNNGNGGRLTLTPDQAHLDDGFGRALLSLRGTQEPDGAVERAARFLHAEIAGEVPCRSCGCTQTWACDHGCAWAEPGLCTTCADPLTS